MNAPRRCQLMKITFDVAAADARFCDAERSVRAATRQLPLMTSDAAIHPVAESSVDENENVSMPASFL